MTATTCELAWQTNKPLILEEMDFFVKWMALALGRAISPEASENRSTSSPRHPRVRLQQTVRKGHRVHHTVPGPHRLFLAFPRPGPIPPKNV